MKQKKPRRRKAVKSRRLRTIVVTVVVQSADKVVDSIWDGGMGGPKGY